MIYKKLSLKKLMDTAVVGNQPTHSIVAATEDLQTKAHVGKFWLKESQYGAFLSGGLQNNNVGKDGKTYKGYSIIEDDYYNSLLEKIRQFESQIPKTDFENAIDSAYEKPLEEVEF